MNIRVIEKSVTLLFCLKTGGTYVKMYFDALAEMVLYVKKIYPSEVFLFGEHAMKLYSAKLWACETLIALCSEHMEKEPLSVVENFVDAHEIMLGELALDDPKREYFAAALSAAYTIRGHLRQVSK